MTPELYERATALFARFLESPTDQWDALMSEAGKADPQAVEVARRLLSASQDADELLDGDFLSWGLASLLYDDGSDGPEVDEGDPYGLIGEVIDNRYEIQRLIACGGMGAVYQARHIKLPRDLAIKVVPWSDRNRLAIEGAAAVIVKHEAVVAVTDFSRLPGGELYLVMDYVDGRSLRTVLKDHGRLDIRTAVGIARQVASALDAAHAAGFVHRDIKPENILICGAIESPEVRVIDFGIAKHVDKRDATLTEKGALLGTPPYMSPEQLGYESRDGIDEIDGRTDIYSLAVVFFEMVAGARPIADTNVWSLRDKIVAGAHRRLEDVEPAVGADLSKVVAQALAVERTQRPTSAGEFVKAIESSLGQKATMDGDLYRIGRLINGRLFERASLPLFDQTPTISPEMGRANAAGSMALLAKLPVVDTRGRSSAIELFHGDLTALPRDWDVDILVVSAAPNSYDPVRGTLIESLQQRGVELRALAASPDTRYGSLPSSWISNPLDERQATIPARRILCFEPTRERALDATVADLFYSLRMIFHDASSPGVVAMPVVASGSRREPADTMASAILGEALKALRDGINVSRLIIVERDLARAEALAQAARSIG